MPLPWKKSKSGRISRFVTDLQSPKHGGSLVVETGFPTSLIDLFVKNRDRLKKPPSSKRSSNNKTLTTQTQTALDHSHPTRRRVSSPPPHHTRRRVSSPPPSLTRQRVSSPPPPPTRRRVSSPPSPTPHPLSLQRHRSHPQKRDPSLVNDDLPSVSFVQENRHVGEKEDDGNHAGGGCCVLMVVVIKVFMVAVLALSTKKLAVGITLSAFALLFLELVVARVFTLLNLCPNAQTQLDLLIGKLIGKGPKEEEASSSRQERRNKVSFEIIEESNDEITQIVPQSNWEDSSKAKPLRGEKEVQTIRDVVFTIEKSKSAKLKSKIVKKIVPKKLRSYRKKKKMKSKERGKEAEAEAEGSVTEVSSLYSEEIIESDISEKDDVESNPLLLESCGETAIEEIGSKGDLTKAMVLIVIALAGLLSGKVFAIVLTLSCCLILRVFCSKSLTRPKKKISLWGFFSLGCWQFEAKIVCL